MKAAPLSAATPKPHKPVSKHTLNSTYGKMATIPGSSHDSVILPMMDVKGPKRRVRPPYPHVSALSTLDGERFEPDVLRGRIKDWMQEQGITPFRLKLVLAKDIFTFKPLATLHVQVKDPIHAFWFKMRWGTDVARKARGEDEPMIKVLPQPHQIYTHYTVKPHDLGLSQAHLGEGIVIHPSPYTSYRQRSLRTVDGKMLSLSQKMGLAFDKIAKRLSDEIDAEFLRSIATVPKDVAEAIRLEGNARIDARIEADLLTMFNPKNH